MGTQYMSTLVKVTASRRKCTCVGCKKKIQAGEAHARIINWDKTYHFNLCSKCICELDELLFAWDAQDGVKILHEEVYEGIYQPYLEEHRHA